MNFTKQFAFILSAGLFTATFLLSATINPVKAAGEINFHIAVFGDSNSAGFAGIQTWVTKLQTTLNGTTSDFNYIITNYSVGGKTMTDTTDGSSYRDTSQFLSFLNSPTSKADLAIILLGTNDALAQTPTATYTPAYQSFLTLLKESEKVGEVLAVASPPMISPYNCIGPSCPVYDGTNNPYLNWITPYNSYLSANITSYCSTLNSSYPTKPPMACSYISPAIPANGTYIYWDGVHILDNAQQIISTAVKTKMDTYAFSKKFVTNVPVNIDIVNELTSQNVESGQTGGFGSTLPVAIRVSGLTIAKTTLDLRTNLNWSTVSAGVNLGSGKAFIHNLVSAPGTPDSYKLLVPKLVNHQSVYICPGATSLEAVSTNCAGAIQLKTGTTGQYTVNIINITGQDYWEISGVTGTGGLSSPDYPGYTNPLTFTLTPNTSAISTTQNVTATFVASAEFSSGQQIAIDFATGGNFTLASCASPTTDADGNGSNDGSGTVQTNGGPNNDRYIYTFSGSTVQASTNGITLCISVTSPSVPGNYQVDLVDTLGDFSSSLYYVGSENTVNVIGTVDPVLTFVIRTNDDTGDLPNAGGGSIGPNLCNLGNLSDSLVQECSYRLKVGTNAGSGYTITLTSDGSLRKGTDFIDNVVENTQVTTGTEGYGIQLNGGSYDSDGSGVVYSPVLCSEQGTYNDDDTPIATGLLVGVSSALYSCAGPNSPVSTDTTNTALVTHRAEASASTPSGTYVHLVTYTVSASF